MRILLTLLLTEVTTTNPDVIDYIWTFAILNLFNREVKKTKLELKEELKETMKDVFELEVDYTNSNLKDIGVELSTPIEINPNEYLPNEKIDYLVEKSFVKFTRDTKSQILNMLNTGNTAGLENILQKTFKNEEKYNSIISKLMTIYRTESTKMKSDIKLNIQQELLEKYDIRVKRVWLHTLSNTSIVVGENYTPREDHIILNGVKEDNNGYFHNEHGSTKAPGLFGIPSEDINCRCDVYFTLD